MVTQRKDNRSSVPDWSNPYAEFMARVNREKPENLQLYPVQPTDTKYGTVSDLSLRYLAHIYAIHSKIQDIRTLLDGEYDHARRTHLVVVSDDLLRELEVIIGLFTFTLANEVELRDKWKGSPIFTIRDGSVAVIRERDLRAYQRHIEHQPHRPVNPHTLYREIALESVIGLRKKESEEAA